MAETRDLGATDGPMLIFGGPYGNLQATQALLAAAAALGRAAGCRAALIMLPFPDAAHDVDKPADLAFAEVRLAARGGSRG